MNRPEETPRGARPPGTVIAMSVLLGTGAGLELLLWLIGARMFTLYVAIVAGGFTVLILKGYRWVYWVNLGQLSLSLGVDVLQLQIPSWAYGTPAAEVWARTLIAAVMIGLHQFRSFRDWFGIQGGGRRWQTIFWLFVAALTALGQYILPTLYAFRPSS